MPMSILRVDLTTALCKDAIVPKAAKASRGRTR